MNKTNGNKKATAAVAETNVSIAETLRVAMKQAGKTDEQIAKMFNRNVGTNGEIPGTKHVLTGEIEVVSETIGENTVVYFALSTEKGQKLSLQSIMSVSSLSGYVFDTEVEQQFYNEDNNFDDDNNVIPSVQMFKSNVFSTYCKEIAEGEGKNTNKRKIADVEKIEKALPKLPTRNLVELATIISNDTTLLQGVELIYIGKAVRPYTAKKDSPDTVLVDMWKQGYKRVMSSQLWAWTFPTKEAE